VAYGPRSHRSTSVRLKTARSNKELKLTKPGKNGASQLNSSVGRTIGGIMQNVVLLTTLSLLSLAASGGQVDDSLKVVAGEDSQIPNCYLRRILITDGKVVVELTDAEYRDVERTRELSADQLAEVRNAVVREKFFSLPKVLGCLTSATYERHVWVEIPGANTQWCYGTAVTAQAVHLRRRQDRGYKVWEAIRATAEFALGEACKK
jgi:hypothetical protein